VIPKSGNRFSDKITPKTNKQRGGPAKIAERALTEKAFAKVNLTLRILGRRSDGYHEVESLVAFAEVGDLLSLRPGRNLSLDVRGPLAVQAGPIEENLVIKVTHVLMRHVPALTAGRFTLTKRLPAAAGLGGGSADAAAALRLLARANNLKLNDPRLYQAGRETGADVPVCLDSKPRWMRGIGEILSAPVTLPRLFAVLIRPDVALATKDVFAALKAPPLKGDVATRLIDVPAEKTALIKFIDGETNDLERPATGIAPAVVNALRALRSEPACLLARMSGSGSACFGVFASRDAAAAAGRSLSAKHPDWWVKPTVIGAVQ
jgi:4-diphosphocytidyl-2-C-methyl-D-erythritol kinase